MDPKFNDKFVEVLKQEYKSIFEDGPKKMTVNWGNIYKYLGMAIDYTTKGLCKPTIFYYTKQILETFDKIDPKETGTKSSAAPTNLFFVNRWMLQAWYKKEWTVP